MSAAAAFNQLYQADCFVDDMAGAAGSAPTACMATLSAVQESRPANREVFRSPVLLRWVQEIRGAIANNANGDTWKLIGRAALIVCPDPERVRRILPSVASEAGMEFKAIESGQVLDLQFHEGVFGSKPTLVFIEPGPWMQAMGNEDEASDRAAGILNFRAQFKEFLHLAPTGAPVVFATAADEFTDLAVAYRQVGFFDRRFVIRPPSVEDLQVAFIDEIGAQHCGKSLTNSSGKLGRLLSVEQVDERRLGIFALAMKRQAVREGRKVEFVDLVKLAVHGTAEVDAPSEPLAGEYRVATHEAGHAVIAMVDSGGRNIPDFVSIVPGDDCKGAMAGSYDCAFERSERYSFSDARQKIRILLAGRAAEHLVFGAEHVSMYSAGEDLKEIGKTTASMFARCGLAPAMDNSGAGSNLAVVFGECTYSEAAHVESLSREFLAVQYTNVLELLAGHRRLLEAITQRLVKDLVITQTELEKMGTEILGWAACATVKLAGTPVFAAEACAAGPIKAINSCGFI